MGRDRSLPEPCPSAPALFEAAFHHHRAGRLVEAERVYRQALDAEPRHADSLHWLGVVAHQTGRYDVAVELIEQAIGIRSGVASCHDSLGNALRRLGRLDEAAAQGMRALALDPDHAEAHNNLGITLRAQGRLDEAAARFARAAAIRPDYAEAHYNLGNLLQDRDRPDEAIPYYRRALALRPDYAKAHINLGNALKGLGRRDEVLTCFRRAAAVDPDHAEAHYNLGTLLQEEDRLEEAVACFRRALALKPAYVEAHVNLGKACRDLEKPGEAAAHYEKAIALQPDCAAAHYNRGVLFEDEGKPEDAAACFRRALALRPDYPEACINLGNVLRILGRDGEALGRYRCALSIKPDYAEAHVNEAMLLLRAGDFAAGWRAYEWRWRLARMKPLVLAAPLWDGGDPGGKTILLHGEQGLGDSIQFIRYAALLKARGARVLVSCPSSLARLFRSVAGIDQICAEEAAAPSCDFHAPLLGLPLLFGTGLATIPAAVPYIFPAPDAAARWARRLQAYPGLKAGLVWAGNPRPDQPGAHATDRRRSMRLDQFAPLAGVAGVHFFSLQKGAPAAQAKTPPPGLALADFMDEVEDFADTAALIASLDLVIGVDTSVIHLAGAMGKPVWVLSRFDGCWRWLLERDDSPWYPTLRLFRQAQREDWQPAVENLCTALRAWPQP